MSKQALEYLILSQGVKYLQHWRPTEWLKSSFALLPLTKFFFSFLISVRFKKIWMFGLKHVPSLAPCIQNWHLSSVMAVSTIVTFIMVSHSSTSIPFLSYFLLQLLELHDTQLFKYLLIWFICFSTFWHCNVFLNYLSAIPVLSC